MMTDSLTLTTWIAQHPNGPAPFPTEASARQSAEAWARQYGTPGRYEVEVHTYRVGTVVVVRAFGRDRRGTVTRLGKTRVTVLYERNAAGALHERVFTACEVRPLVDQPEPAEVEPAEVEAVEPAPVEPAPVERPALRVGFSEQDESTWSNANLPAGFEWRPVADEPSESDEWHLWTSDGRDLTQALWDARAQQRDDLEPDTDERGVELAELASERASHDAEQAAESAAWSALSAPDDCPSCAEGGEPDQCDQYCPTRTRAGSTSPATLDGLCPVMDPHGAGYVPAWPVLRSRHASAEAIEAAMATGKQHAAAERAGRRCWQCGAPVAGSCCLDCGTVDLPRPASPVTYQASR
jgi:hypothetical protein